MASTHVRSVTSWLVTVLAGLLVLTVLNAPTELGRFGPAAFVRIPVEALGLLAVAVRLPNRIARRLAVAAGVLLGLLTILKLFDLGFQATLLSGLWVNNQQRYDALLKSNRLTLSSAFKQANWRTVTVMPDTNKPWPEGSFYGYDKTYASYDLGTAARHSVGPRCRTSTPWPSCSTPSWRRRGTAARCWRKWIWCRATRHGRRSRQ